MKILLFAGSLRAASLNKKLIRFSDKTLKNKPEHQTMVVDLQSLKIPVYDGDIEATGIPEGVLELAKQVAEAETIIISSPEYNGSISAPLKNAIDWLSRVKPMPLTAKPILMLGASPGALGATRGIAYGRIPLENLGNFLYPQSMGFMHADQAFNEKEDLKDLVLVEKLQKLLNDFLIYSKKIK